MMSCWVPRISHNSEENIFYDRNINPKTNLIATYYPIHLSLNKTFSEETSPSHSRAWSSAVGASIEMLLPLLRVSAHAACAHAPPLQRQIRRRFGRYYEFKYILPWLKGTITISHGLLQIMAQAARSLQPPWQDIERRWKVNKIIK